MHNAFYIFQIFIRESAPALKTSSPKHTQDTYNTVPVCPSKVFIHVPSSKFQILTVPSPLPEARIFYTGEKLTSQTPLLCPYSTIILDNYDALHIFIDLS